MGAAAPGALEVVAHLAAGPDLTAGTEGETIGVRCVNELDPLLRQGVDSFGVTAVGADVDAQLDVVQHEGGKAVPWLDTEGLPLGDRRVVLPVVAQVAVGPHENLGVVITFAPLLHHAYGQVEIVLSGNLRQLVRKGPGHRLRRVQDGGVAGVAGQGHFREGDESGSFRNSAIDPPSEVGEVGPGVAYEADGGNKRDGYLWHGTAHIDRGVKRDMLRAGRRMSTRSPSPTRSE